MYQLGIMDRKFFSVKYVCKRRDVINLIFFYFSQIPGERFVAPPLLTVTPYLLAKLSLNRGGGLQTVSMEIDVFYFYIYFNWICFTYIAL